MTNNIMSKKKEIETTEMAIDKAMSILKKTGHYTAEIVNVEFNQDEGSWKINAESKTKKFDMAISKTEGELTKFTSLDQI